MKGLKKKLRRGLAGFLSFVLTMTSFNMVSWADVAAAFEKENATFVMSGEDLRDSAQAAIDNGDEFNFEDLGVDTSDRSLAKEYQRLFETGSVFEFAPAYDMDEEEYADGAELRMFIRINGDPEGYQITGDEDIIFLYINDSDARVTFRSRIDGYTTQKVTVKGNSTLLDAEAPTAPVGGEGNGNGAGGTGANGGAGSEVQNPDGNAGGEDGAVDGTVQNPDGNANMGEAADGNSTTNGDVQNPDANAGGAIDGEGAASGDVQNPDAGLDGENGNAADDVQNPDANVSDGNGTNDGTVQNPDANADGENTDHSNTNTGKEEQVQKPEDHTGTNGGVQNSDTNKTEDGGKAEAGNSESGSSNSGAASDGGASNSGASDGGASNSGASNNGASDSGSSNSGASDSSSSDSGSDQGDSLVSAATLNRHYTHILTTAANGDAGSKESDKVSSDEGKEDKVDAADKTDKADNIDTSDKHDSEDVNSDTNTEDGSNGSNGGSADKDAVVTPDGEEGNSAVEDNKADAVTPDNGENQDPSDDKADDQGEVSKPDDGQGDAVIDDNSDKDNADKDNADKNAAEDNKADDTTVDGKDHAANGEDGKKNDPLVVDPEADEKEEVSKTGTTSGKTYGQVVLDESYYAKAYVTTLNKLHIDVSKEGYAVTYTVTPVGTAAVKGAKNVEEGKDLTFTVKPQVGYVIDHVTANGESLEAVEDDEATDSNADTGVKRFVVPEIEEEQEIVVVMAEIGEHPEFNFSKTLGDVVVSLHAEEGILPAGTVAKVTEVTEKVEEAVKEKTAEETGEDTSANTVLAYDIKLFVENEAGELEALDNSWSENGYVEVTFAGKAIEEKSAEAEKVEITHIDTGDVDATSESVEKVSVEEVEKVESVSDAVDVADNNSIEMIAFEAEHFSIYAIYFTNTSMAAKIRTMSIDGKSIGTNNGDWWSRFTLTTSGLMISNIAQDIKNNESEAFKSYKFVKATIGNQYDGESVLRIRQQAKRKYILEYSLKDKGDSWQSFNSNEDLYFWFEPITITVTFDPNEDYGGTGEPFTVIVGDEGKIITPDNPFTNKNGYEFVGWHGEKSGHHSGTEMLQQTFIEGVQYPPNIDNKTNTITSDITLYATWLNKKGTDGQEAKFFIRTDGKAPFEPNGYGASDYYPSTTQTQLTGTLRNKIEINNNPEMVAANILKEPSGTAIAAAAKKAGKSFNPDTQKVLWYVIKDQGDWHVDGIVVDKNTYSVRYWPNGGNENVPPTQNYSEGTTVRVNYNNIPARIGYEFLGWDTDKASTSPRYVSNGTNNSFVIKDANVDLYAIWKPKDGIPFTVEHYTQQLDKSYPQKTTDVATKYSTTGTIVKDDDYKKTMPGFTYVSGIVDNITEAEVQGDGSTVLKLYYTRNTDTPYTIEHYQQSVENPEEYKLVETDTETGSGVTGEKAAFTPKDYTNDGFEYNAALTMPEDRTITGDGKLVVKLYYDRKSYSVKYEYTGNVPDGVSSLPQAKTYRVGEDVTIAADAAAKGYSFSGWKINGKDAEMFKMPAHDIKITGSFGVNSYTVTYKVDNSTYGAVETYQYGENVSLREKPVKEGYSFKGWSRDSGFTMPAENVVIEGHFEINKYTVRYEVDGALYGEEESYDFGEMVEIREEPTKDGYTFSHWSQKEAFTMPANDVVIKGNFSINSYNVTYKVDGVQYGDTETHEYGSAVTLRAEPEAEGYTFSGWNRENNFTMPAEDVVIEGSFKINSYTVTYKVDGEISGEAETYEYGAVVTLREEPVKEGYTFSHWSRESGFTMPAENIVVEGHFKINSYTVTYKVDDQLYGKVDTYKFGEDVTLRDAPTKEGYTFSGWSETSGFKMPAKDVEIKGNFSINDYTVTYKVDGKVIDEKKHQYNEEVTVRADETKEGYTFSGWSSEDVKQSFIQRLLSSSIAGKTFRMPAKDVVIEGHFDINSYKVTYQVDGVQSGEIETYEYGTLVTIRDDLEKEGHKFSGWNLKEDFAMPAEDVVIVGSFTANEYTVTYLVDGKPYETAETYLYGTAVKLKEAPEKEGYTFSGWDHEEDFTMPAENVVINGSFSINSYKVTYEVDGSAYGKEETYQYGSAVTLQKEPKKEGYTFSKWDHEDGFAMPAHDVVIKGSFKINSYKVTYKVDGEQVGEAETYEFNAPVTLREAPEKEGYTFSGWSRDTGFNMPAKDVVIEGSFTINNYTVTYLVDGKQTGETETYQYNQEVTVKADAEREGYTFSGWSSEDVKENFIQKLLSNSIAGRTFHMPAKNVEIEGSFDINSYKVTYKVDGKPVGEVETYNYGTLVTVRQSPEKEGYTFSGWSRTEAFEMPARDIVIEGSYKINSYTVTYKVDGEQYGEMETYEYGAAVTLREKPSREGYTFKGWSYENGFKMPAEDVVIEGSYEINSYTVTYKVDGQQYGEPEVYKYNELVRLKSEPTKEGYTFSHWNYGEDFLMPAKDVVIEGSFGINSYTVTYKVDGVQYGDTETHKYGSAVTLRAEPETEGYTFSGWNRENNFTMPAEDVVIEGSFKINSYTVTYKVDGEISGEAETYEYGAVVTLREEPVKEGYTFSHWSRESGFTMPAENIVVEGHFKINSYTVTYKVDDQLYGKVDTYKFGEDVTLRDAPTKEGYTFSGWSETSGFKMPAKDVEIKGNFSINDYTVTYKVDGKVIDEKKHQYNEEVTVRADETKEGYTFSGWSSEDVKQSFIQRLLSSSIAGKTFRMPAKDVVIEGHFDINSYKVTYQVDGVQSGEIETYEYGTLVTIRDDLEKEGHKFSGWNLKEDFAMPAEDVVIVGSFTANEYTVTYLVDGKPYETAETYLYGTAVKLKEAPEKEGYTFSGWDHEEDFTMPAENVVINGSFSINSYKVTYEVDGSAYGKEETYQYGSAVTLQKEPKKEGYTFSKWDHEDGFAMPAHDVVIKGSFKINSYKVTYKVDGEQVGEAETYEFNAPVTLREAPEKEGYTFSGWSRDTGFNMPAKDVVIEGSFTINNYTVTYLVDGKQTGETETYQYNQEVTVKADAEREGYTFSGWSSEDVKENFIQKLLSNSIAGRTFHMPAKNVEIEGSFDINSYKVTYKVDGKPVGEVETYNYGTLVTVRQSPEKEGYTFSGWSRTEAFEMPARDIVIEGSYKINSYTVTYKVDGEQYGEMETYEYGAAVTLREKPSREGYTFKGWSYENGFKMPAEDVVIEGSYEINSYTVTYKVDGQQYGEPEVYKYNELVRLKSEPTKEGYTFSHWNYGEDFRMPAKDVVIEGNFGINSYTVTYKVDGVQYGSTETYEYGSAVTLREEPEREGYTFNGWNRKGNFTMPAGDIVIEGSFKINSYTVTYKVDGEISGETESYEYGADVSLREEPVKEGYTFSHWSRTTGFTMPAENVVIEGSFKINSYTVTYIVDGEITGEVESYEYGTEVKLRSEPSKEGHEFGGWNRTEDFTMPAENVVIEGNFDVNEYTVTYLVDGKDYGEKETYKYGTNVTLRKDPEKEGHTFSGWNQTDGFVMPAKNVVIEGSFSINSYTVVYKVDGEVVGDTESYEFGAPVSLRTEPQKEGYTFSGWDRESGFNMPAENVEIEGHYSINSYTVTYKVDGELYGDIETYEYNAPVELRQEPQKEGYTFGGWSSETGFNMPAENVVIEGSFKVNEYTVTYFVDDKFYDSIETYSYGSQVKLKEAPQKEGYTFSGWDHDDRFTMPAEDIVVKGSFNINSYKVTYEVDGTPYGMVEIYKYGELVTLQKNPTKEGYTFSGWDHSNEFAMPARDVKIKGSFIVNSYTVTYKVDGAQIGEPETYKYGEAVTLREKPSKEGYTFNGWSYETGFEMPAEDVVIEGSYQINSYTVTYKVDGEQFGEQETYEFNELVQLRSEPTKEGYTFSHWNRSSEFNMPANDVVIEGSFKINSYTVTYKVDGSQYGSTETYEYGSAVVLREEPKKEGYTFSGWDHEDNFMMPADDVVIEGTYQINSYTVTYKVDGEVSGEVETYEYGAEVTLRGEPVKEGYTFSHWSQDTGFTMPAKNMVIEGNFLINSYTVTYKVDGEIYGEVETYNYGTVVNLRSEPIKEGHKFGGWNRTEDFTMPAENVIIEGNFDVNEYTVTYLVDGKDYGEKETYKYGTPVILRDNPEKEGYTFSGWNPATGFMMPARNVVIEGSYRINSYTVTYKVDGEQYGEPETHAYGELVQLKPEPTKEGYTFSHWNQNAEFTMPAQDVVVEGNFSINSYTVTYKVDGTQYGENETYEYGSTVTLREEPKMEGYTFSGWSQTTEFKMPAEDVVIEGSYKINSYTVTYKVDGEQYGETESHEYGALVQLKSEPTKEGYTFSHWNQNAEFTMPAKDVVVEGSFSINSYTVTYKVDGSQYGEIETYEYGSPVTMREVPKEKGYTFSGWDREEDFTMPAENVVIEGTFSVNSYTVTYKVDGEISGAVETYEYGREVTLREEPLKEGYTFSHWNQETGFTMPAENVVIEGSFHVNSYTVTYKVDGVITGEVETYEYGTAVKLRSEPIKEGHKFGGWNRTEDFIMPAENVVIEGNFDVNEYIVTYLVDGKDYGEKEMYKYGTPVTLRKDPEKEGHTFSGWNQTDGFMMPARNVVIEGSFNVNNYTVVYKIDGEVVGDTESYEFGAPVSLRSEPRKEGYTFSGWNRESGFNMPAENVVIEGRYSINSYTVTYKVDGELYGSVETYEYNSPVTVKVDPTKSGYTFSGWDKTGTFRMPAQDIEITGTFSRNSNNNGGNGGGSTPDNNKPYVPNGPGTDDGPTVTIDPDAVPLANAPVDGNPTDNLILIDDGNVPLAGLPKTGDRAGAQAGLAAILSGFLLAAFTMLNNKKKEENK